jgi:hypothetical protein
MNIYRFRYINYERIRSRKFELKETVPATSVNLKNYLHYLFKQKIFWIFDYITDGLYGKVKECNYDEKLKILYIQIDWCDNFIKEYIEYNPFLKIIQFNDNKINLDDCAYLIESFCKSEYNNDIDTYGSTLELIVDKQIKCRTQDT